MEIKFKVWDKKEKYMIKTPLSISALAKEDNLMLPKKTDNYIFRLFTGEKDKNRIKMYAGDIVKYEVDRVFTEEYPDESFIEEEIRFEGGAFYPICTQPGNTFEVIGNIYEK